MNYDRYVLSGKDSTELLYSLDNALSDFWVVDGDDLCSENEYIWLCKDDASGGEEGSAVQIILEKEVKRPGIVNVFAEGYDVSIRGPESENEFMDELCVRISECLGGSYVMHAPGVGMIEESFGVPDIRSKKLGLQDKIVEHARMKKLGLL